jgi:hypothetical protein
MQSHRRGCGGTSSSLGMGSPVPCHVVGDRGLTNVDAELEEFSIADFERHLRSARREIATSIARTNENRHDANE